MVSGRAAPPSAVHPRALRLTNAGREQSFPNCRPRDAATLIIIDWDGSAPRILMGRRDPRHRFMPGKFVFPGGRVEPVDYRVAAARELDPRITAKLLRDLSGRAGPGRARALAIAALRETGEETGLLIGEMRCARADVPRRWQGAALPAVVPCLDRLALVARAITPPKRPRRFDTRFFAVDARHIARRRGGHDGEFLELHWLTFEAARRQDLPMVTRVVLEDLEDRINDATLNDPDAPVPYYFTRGACFHRKLL